MTKAKNPIDNILERLPVVLVDMLSAETKARLAKRSNLVFTPEEERAIAEHVLRKLLDDVSPEEKPLSYEEAQQQAAQHIEKTVKFNQSIEQMGVTGSLDD